MHIAKFKGAGALQVVKHIERDRPSTAVYGNERIDAERTKQNYEVVLHRKDDGSAVPFQRFTEALERAKQIHATSAGKQARSDAVTLASAVIQLPREYCNVRADGVAVPVDGKQAEQFFHTVAVETLKHFGARHDMLISAEVHMDETTPHVHVCWIPLTHEGRLQWKGQVNRNSLKSYHDKVDAVLRAKYSWYRGGLVSDEPSERLKASDNLSMREVRQAKSQLARVKAKTREAVRAYAIVDDLPKSEREVYEQFLKKRGLTADFEQYKRDIRSVANVLQSVDIRNPNTKGGREL